MILKSRFIEYLFGCCLESYPVDTGRNLNVRKTFRRRPGRLLNVLCTFKLRPVFTGYFFMILTPSVELLQYRKQGLVV